MKLLTIVIGIIEWTVAIASVLGTLMLVGWILKMIFIKDKKDEQNECKPDRAQPTNK